MAETVQERATPSGIERGSVLFYMNNYTTPSGGFEIRNTLTARKNWRCDAPIILPGWECTRGSRSTPTVPECLCGGKPWVAHQRLNCGVEPTPLQQKLQTNHHNKLMWPVNGNSSVWCSTDSFTKTRKSKIISEATQIFVAV